MKNSEFNWKFQESVKKISMSGDHFIDQCLRGKWRGFHEWGQSASVSSLSRAYPSTMTLGAVGQYLAR